MADPFQNADAAGAEFIAFFADTMDKRQAEPAMEAIVAAYLDRLTFSADSLTVEIGCGAGAVTRRIAGRAAPGRVRAFDRSESFVSEAVKRLTDVDNAVFAAVDGTTIPVEDGAADHVIMHTLLTHVVDPQPIVTEAARLLRPGGTMVICDSDFSKGTLASGPNDPLESMGRAFVAGFVTDPHITSKLRPMAMAAGLVITDFSLTPRVVTEGDGMLSWVAMPAKEMVARGEIGQPLYDALVGEYARRRDAGTLYGFQVFATLIATKPG